MNSDYKRELRKTVRERGARYGDDYRAECSRRLLEKVEAMPEFQKARTVALYWSLPDEVQTHDFVRRWAAGKRVLLPVCEGIEPPRMVFKGYRPEAALTEGAYGIGEPCGDECPAGEIDFVLVPGVAFDRKGNRMGRGKGFYDRYLAGCGAYKAGICFGYQMVDAVPCDGHDIKMDCVVTEP